MQDADLGDLVLEVDDDDDSHNVRMTQRHNVSRHSPSLKPNFPYRHSHTIRPPCVSSPDSLFFDVCFPALFFLTRNI